MNTQSKTVLIVDDEPIILDILAETFKSAHYKTVTATDAKKAMHILTESKNDICMIISDINMPVVDGYMFCQTIRNSSEYEDIPFIFSSSLNSLEDKIKGYNSGADDYMTKPVVPDELLLKTDNLLKNKITHHKFKQQLDEANNTALQAITYSSDLGRVVNFYEEAMLAVSFDDLANRLFSLTRTYNLKCSLYINDGFEEIIIADEGYASPLEKKVFEQAREQGRFFDFGKRTLVNYENHSLLIKNMPVDDEIKYGLIKDILGALCNAVSAKIELLINQSNSERQKAAVFEILRSAIDSIEKSSSELQSKNIRIIEDMSEKIDHVIMSLALMEETEGKLENIVSECLDLTNKNFYEGLKLNDVFEYVRIKIDECMLTNPPQKTQLLVNNNCSEPELF